MFLFFFIANSTSNSILNCQSCYCSGIVCFLLSTLLHFNVQRTKIVKNAYEFHPLLISLWFLLLPAVFFLSNYIFTHIPSDWTVLITLTPCCIWKTLCRAQLFLIVNFFLVRLVVTCLSIVTLLLIVMFWLRPAGLLQVMVKIYWAVVHSTPLREGNYTL